MSAAVGRGDVDGQGQPGPLDHLQHLELGVQLQAVAALTLHQGGSRSEHPGQPAAQGAQQLRGLRGPRVLHREVNPSTGPVHVHVGGTCQLWDGRTFEPPLILKENKKVQQNKNTTYLHCKLVHPVSSPDRVGVGIDQPCNNKLLMTGLVEPKVNSGK